MEVNDTLAVIMVVARIVVIKSMIKIYALAENTAKNSNYSFEHGLSLYIETTNHKILFDSGQSDMFINNAVLLGLDLSKVDIAVLSHGHYDHGGGLEKFLEINATAPIYMNRNAFGNFYNGTKKYIGLSETLKKSNRIIFIGDELKIDDELQLCTCNNQKEIYPLDSAGLKEKISEGFSNDLFLHEQYLIINDCNKKIVVSGCSHKGVLNIMNWLNPDVFVGGFHFMKQNISDEGNDVLDNASEILSGYLAVYYTCHCTGFEQYCYLKEKMGEQLHYISSGETIML